MSALSVLKRLVPPTIRRQYHHLLAFVAHWRYGRPTRHLIVIGVTGTDGKTTTVSLIADVLAATGAQVGVSSSAFFQVGDRRWPNDSHLTMPGRFTLPRLLRQMVNASCRYAVIEVSSEGMVQYRHSGIDFDVAVITNLSPEHIEAHGSFDAYRQAKGLLFTSIIRGGDKHFGGTVIPKITVVNLDDQAHDFYLRYWAEAHYGTSLRGHEAEQLPSGEKLTIVAARDVHLAAQQSTFSVDGHAFTIPLAGEHNVRNALQAIAVGRSLGLDWEVVTSGLAAARPIPGRGQEIPTGRPWRLIVDNALTPAALEQCYRALQQGGTQRIIAVFGAAGGGRDAWKRPELGKIAARYCAHIILTTDDPYDEDPARIAEAIKQGIPSADAHRAEIILDRRAAIRQAMTLAQAGDVIAVTGMGSESSMMIRGKRVSWNDATVAGEELGQ